jgi:hypothetical protein
MSTFLRTDDTTKRIVSMTFVKDTDDSPDLSHLGLSQRLSLRLH